MFSLPQYTFLAMEQESREQALHKELAAGYKTGIGESYNQIPLSIFKYPEWGQQQVRELGELMIEEENFQRVFESARALCNFKRGDLDYVYCPDEAVRVLDWKNGVCCYGRIVEGVRGLHWKVKLLVRSNTGPYVFMVSPTNIWAANIQPATEAEKKLIAELEPKSIFARDYTE